MINNARRSKSIEERVSLLEAKLKDTESRLSALEGATENNTDSEQVFSSTVPENKEDKVSLISVILISKKFYKANLMAGDAGDRIDFVLLFRSNLKRNLRAFKGAVIIKDLFNEEILKITLTHETGICTGSKTEWKGGIQYNQFLASHQRFLNVDTKDTTVSFDLEGIVYTDGTHESFV